MTSPRCDRCGAAGTDADPIRSITICLDDRTASGKLCGKHHTIARTDVGAQMFSLTEIAGHTVASRGPLTNPFPDLAPAPGRHRVPIITARRVVRIPDETVTTPHLPIGVDLNALRRATQLWSMPEHVRSRLNADDIDPVDVFLAAQSNDGFTEPPDSAGDEYKVVGNLRVKLNSQTNTILGARRYRKQGT